MGMMERVTLSKRRTARWRRQPHRALCAKGVAWGVWLVPSWPGLFVPNMNSGQTQGMTRTNGERVGSLFLSLDDTWAALPTLDVVRRELKEWGIYDPTLPEVKLQERWVRFHGVEFGVAPKGEWAGMRR